MRDEMFTLLDGSKLPKDHVLGVLTMFTVPDEPVSGVKLTKLWAAEGLDPALIPDVRKPVNVFQQACRSVETRRGGSNANGHRTEVKVDEVTNLGSACVYQITRMVRDTANNVIDHPKAMTLTLDKDAAEAGDPDPITCKPLDPTTYGALKGLEDRVLAYYTKNLVTVPGQKIRNAVRDYMRMLGGENVRRKSGGVYFVPLSGVDTLESIDRVLQKLYGGEADLHTIPQPNSKAVAEMVAKHHTLNVIKECDEIIARISDRLKEKRKVRKDLLTNLMQQRRELGVRRKQYIALLGQEQDAANTRIEILDDQLDKLMEAAI